MKPIRLTLESINLGKSITRSTKIYLNESQWDDQKKLIRNTNHDAKILNRRLQKDIADLQSELLLQTIRK